MVQTQIDVWLPGVGRVHAVIKRNTSIALAYHMNHSPALGEQPRQLESQRKVHFFFAQPPCADAPFVLPAVGWVYAHPQAGERPPAHVAVHPVRYVAGDVGHTTLLQETQTLQSGITHYAIDVEAGVALKLGHGDLKQRREDAVHRSAVEAQFIKPSLQEEHVIAAHTGNTQVKQTVARGAPCLNQFSPGIGLDDSSGAQQATLLERPDGRLSIGSKDTIRALVAQVVTQGRQTRLDIYHPLASVSSSDRTHWAIILTGMAVPDTSGHPRKSKTFTIVVSLLWISALVAAGLMIVFWQTGAFTPPTTTLPPTTTEASSTTEAPTTTEIPTTTTTLPPALTITAGGDVMGDRKMATFLDKNGGAAAFEGVKPYFEGAHIGFVNLEGAISDTGSRNTVKEYTFRSRVALIDGLTSAGIDVVSLANNHVLDYRWAALADCISRLDSAGIKHAGAGKDFDTASAPVILDTPAGKVSMIAVSQITASFASTSSRPGTYYVSEDSISKALLAKVTEASQQSDFVVVSIHWGVEYKTVANSKQTSLAHALIDAGADLVLGHHPHVVQGMEIYKDRLIVYSLGDFVFHHYSRITGEAFVLQVSLPRDGSAPYGTLTPVYLTDSHGVPEVVTGKDAKRILDRMAKLSAKLGLELAREGDTATFGTAPSVTPGADPSASSTTTSSTPGTTTTVTPGATTTSVAP